MSSMSVSSIPPPPEWCVACLQDNTRVLAAKVLAGVPLCRGCADNFGDDPHGLRDIRKYAESLSPEAKGPLPMAKRATEPVEAAASDAKCACGKPLRHVGRCHGHKRTRMTQPAEPVASARPKKAIPLQRVGTITPESVSQAFPNAEPFVADSMLQVSLGTGTVALMYRGDLFELMQDRRDLAFVRRLVDICRDYQGKGEKWHSRDGSRTGKLLDIKIDEGFLEDMLANMEPEEKAKVLTAIWNNTLP